MNVLMTQSEILSILDSIPVHHPMRDRLQSLVRESSTLRVLHEIGLEGNDDSRAKEDFNTWPGKDTVVYSSEEDARKEMPGAFRDVCTEWGRAGYLGRNFKLKDGRTVVARGVWWSVPEPGGRTVAYYFA